MAEILPTIDWGGVVVIAPTMHSMVLDGFAATYIRQMLPYVDFRKDWEAYLPLPLLHDPLSQAFGIACEALILASTAVVGAGRSFNAEEEAFIESASTGLKEAVACLATAWAEEEIAAADYALDVLKAMGAQLAREVNGEHEGETIAVGAFSGLKGVMGEVGKHIVQCKMAFAAHHLGVDLE